MTKLYYTDPLKAAWMSREFGVDLRTNGCRTALPLWIFGRWIENKWDKVAEIHPDSLSIFKPMEGDVYEVDVTEDVPVYHERARFGDAPMYYKSRSSPYHQFQIYKNNPNGVFKRIVERNGKAFFMPEVEA